jgi:hypothetical protein
MSYHTAVEWQEPETHYFSVITQSQLDECFHFLLPNSQARLEREEVKEPFLPCAIWSD